MKTHTKLLAVTIILAALVSFAPVLLARITLNTIDAQAIVTNNGRHLVVTGPIQGDTAGERLYLRVTITQRTTGAMAEGVAVFTLTGELQQWQVAATTDGKATFEPGPATAVAIARTALGGNTSDAHQWLVNVTLVNQ